MEGNWQNFLQPLTQCLVAQISAGVAVTLEGGVESSPASLRIAVPNHEHTYTCTQLHTHTDTHLTTCTYNYTHLHTFMHSMNHLLNNYLLEIH